MKKHLPKIKKVIQTSKQAYETGRDIQKERAEARNKRFEEAAKIRKFGSLAAAKAYEEQLAHREEVNKRHAKKMMELLRKSEEMQEEEVRYPEVMERNKGRVAIVTNFSGENHDFRSPEATARATADRLADVLQKSDVVIVEAFAQAPEAYKLPDFEQSAELLGSVISQLDQDTKPEVVVSSFESEFMALTPVQVQKRIEHHEQEHPDNTISYIAVTSALKLHALGVGVEQSFLGAHGETYDQIVRGGIIVPETTAPNDSWAAVPRG